MQIRLYQPEDLEQTVTLWWNTRQTAFPYINEQYTNDYVHIFLQGCVALKNQVWVNGTDGSCIKRPV